MRPNTNASPSAQEIKARSGDVCYSCEGVLWVDFFFDGFGYSIPEFGGTGNETSNIGKLYRSHEVDLQKYDRRPFYYPGLGARFDPELAVIGNTAASQLLKDAQDKVTPKNPVDNAKQEATDYAKGKLKDLRSNPSAEGVKDVLSSVAKDADNMASRSIRHAGRVVERGAKATLDEGVRIARRKLAGTVSHWRKLAVDVARHPWRTLKLAFVEEFLTWEGIKYIAARAGEATSARDWKWVSFLFNRGVDTRLDAAVEDFKKAVGNANKLYSIKHINVAVFGYDNGGALAIAFANRLMNEVCNKRGYEGIEVNLKFIGLFDCVAHRYSDNLLLGYIPLSNAVVDDLQIPKQAEKVVHVCAAHEYRFYKPLSIIKGKPELGAKYEEWLYPGSQADVGGGYVDGDYGKSSQLARVALNFMHMQARRQAVPLFSLDSLKSLPDLGPIYADFVVDESVRQLVESYRKQAIEKAKIVVPLTADEMTGQGMMADSGCIRGPSLLTPMTRLPDTLKEELKGHQALFLLWYRSLYDSNSDVSDPAFSLFRHEMKLLSRTGSGAALMGDVKEFYEVWKSAAGKQVSSDVFQLFTVYVHDSVVEIDEVLADTLTAATDVLYCGPNLLRYRNTLEIEKQPETDWLDDAQKAWVAYAQTLNEIGPSGYPQTASPKTISVDSRIGL